LNTGNNQLKADHQIAFVDDFVAEKTSTKMNDRSSKLIFVISPSDIKISGSTQIFYELNSIEIQYKKLNRKE
jgi:hypothetical protein